MKPEYLENNKDKTISSA